jgi:hypothetical protein
MQNQTLRDLKTTEEKHAFILEQIKRNAANQKDEILETGQLLHMGPEGWQELLKHEDNTLSTRKFPLTQYAESQFLGRLNCQAGYIHRCPKWLQAANVNHWILHFQNKKIMARWKGESIRAIFSSRFNPELDDHMLYPVVLDALEASCEASDRSLLHIREFTQTGDFTILRAYFKNCRTEFNGSVYFAGITVVNSEVGRSSVWICPTIRGGDKTGAFDYTDRSLEGRTSIRHVSDLDIGKITKSVNMALEIAQTGVHRLLETSTEQVEKPLEEIQHIVGTTDFVSQRIAAILEEEYKEIQITTKLALAQSILRAVKELPLYQRFLIEGEVGSYLGIFQDSKKRLESIVNEIQQEEVNVTGM